MEESKVICTRCDFTCDDMLVGLDHMATEHPESELAAPEFGGHGQ